MIIAGTGHRPNKLGGYLQSVTDDLVNLATVALRKSKPDRVISGMAIGWDQALAQAAVDLAIPLDAYVPFAGQEGAWPPKARDHYHWLLQRAASVKYTSTPGYAPQKMQLRNIAMVDDCDKLLALYDGTSGGTRNCIDYAHKQGVVIVNLWDMWQKGRAK